MAESARVNLEVETKKKCEIARKEGEEKARREMGVGAGVALGGAGVALAAGALVEGAEASAELAADAGKDAIEGV